MAKRVLVKASRRNGKAVKQHYRTVKGSAAKSGAGKELASKKEYSDSSVTRHVARMILKDRLGNPRYDKALEKHPDYVAGTKSETHLESAGFLDNEGAIKLSAKKKFPKAHAYFMKHADY